MACITLNGCTLRGTIRSAPIRQRGYITLGALYFAFEVEPSFAPYRNQIETGLTVSTITAATEKLFQSAQADYNTFIKFSDSNTLYEAIEAVKHLIQVFKGYAGKQTNYQYQEPILKKIAIMENTWLKELTKKYNIATADERKKMPDVSVIEHSLLDIVSTLKAKYDSSAGKDYAIESYITAIAIPYLDTVVVYSGWSFADQQKVQGLVNEARTYIRKINALGNQADVAAQVARGVAPDQIRVSSIVNPIITTGSSTKDFVDYKKIQQGQITAAVEAMDRYTAALRSLIGSSNKAQAKQQGELIVSQVKGYTSTMAAGVSVAPAFTAANERFNAAVQAMNDYLAGKESSNTGLLLMIGAAGIGALALLT